MAFLSINKQFTLQSFTAYLATLPRPIWPRASCYHNSYRPTEAEWQGLATMQSMQAHYVSLGWTTGPHVFIALHSPNPANDGIWVMTPPTVPGTHAGTCNADHFGIEVVGDFRVRAPSAAQQGLLIGVLDALHRWVGLGPALDAHRDCMPDRVCPGDAFYALKPQLQQQLAAALAADVWPARWGPVATPAGDQWGWANVTAWKANWTRLGHCRSHLLYDNDHNAAVQLFDGGDVRLFGNIPEVTFT